MAVTSKRVISQSGKVLDAASLVEEKDRRREARERTEQRRQAEQAQKRQDAFNAFNNAVNPGLSQRELIQGIERNQARQAEQEAKRQYEDYKQSEQRQEDWKKSIHDAVMGMPAAGSSLDLELGKLPEKTINQTEAQHEAVANYYEQNRKATEDRHTMEKDVAEVEAMSAEDRRLLETYAYGRNEWFDHQRIADSISARAELEKKYGKQKVEELAESWQRYQNAVSAEKNRQQTQEGAGSGFLAGAGHSAVSVAANALGTLTAPFGYLQEAFGRTGRYQTLDPNNAGAMPVQYASAVREGVTEDMGTAGKVLYQGTMGALDNLARIALGGGTKFGSLGLAALGSFGSTLSEASAQGATPAQAVGKAVLSAGIEVATEKIGLDELFAAGKGGYKGAAAAFRQALKQGGIEAAEEEISLLGNVLVDALVMREKSAYNQQIGELVANGMSYADAKAQADRALWDEAVNTALTSFVSGGVMSGAQSGGQYIAQRQQDNARYKAELNRDIQAMMQRETSGNATVSKTEAVGEENATADETVGTKRQMSAVDAGNVRYDRNGRTELPVAAPTENGAPDAPQGAEEGFEAMGAASRGFSPYTQMQMDYGNIPEGENAVRPDDAPISTNGEDRVSYTARTAIGAQVTPDEFVPLIENEVVRGGFSFIPISNDETTQNAVQTIQAEGWQTARANWTAAVRQGRAGADITAQGALLYNHAVNSGDFREAMDILLDYQQAVRHSARGLQAARILKRLTPENRLYMIRRSIQRMVEDMHLQREITIDENLARRYQETRDNAEADRILDEIARDVARQIPSTFAERFTALRYLNMLGNFRTQGRNLVGNLVNEGLYLAKDELAATIEGLVSFVSGGRIQRSKTLVRDRETRRAAAADYENVAEWISGGGRTNDRGSESDDFARRVQENRRIFRNPLLEGYRNITNWAMNNDRFGDAAFGRANYARALAGYLNARGIRTNDLSTVDRETLNAAREYAVRQAQEATFRDNNQVSEFVSRELRGRNTPAWARVIGEAVMPFRKTPANVLVRAEEFSPLGLINSAVNTVRAARGDISGAELVDSWAKSITGTGLFAIGWALANMGYLRGGPDEDEDKAAFDKLNGFQDYSIQLPGGINFTIDAFSPTALPLLLGAQLDKVLDGADLTFADLEGMLSTLADPMIEMSMLSGLNDTIDAIRYADNSLGQFFVNAAFNYLTQALGNTLLGQIERSTEESRMTTYIDKDSNIPAWLQRNLGKLSQKIPGLDYNQTEYIDQWGREQKNPEGIKNWLYNLLSPSYIDKVEMDAVAEELYRLHEVTGENVFPQNPETTISYTGSDGNRHEKYNLSAEEADKLKRVQGQTHAKLVADLVGSEDFGALTDDQKAKAAILCRDYARELARGEVLPGYDGKSSWMEGIEGKEAAAIIGKVAGGELSDAMTALATGWREGYDDDSGALEGLESAAKTYEALTPEIQKTVKEGLSGRVAAYLEAREKGMDTETFTSLYRKYWDIDQSGAGASEQAKKWAYELERAEERREITEQQKATLKNSLRFYQNFPAETEKFDQLTEGGLSADEAQGLGWLIQGLKIQDGYKEVRDIQKAEAIAKSTGLSEADKIAALKIYGTDAQDENLDLILEMGGTADDYVAAWQMYTNASGEGKKWRTIQAYMDRFGVDWNTAAAIYDIYG